MFLRVSNVAMAAQQNLAGPSDSDTSSVSDQSVSSRSVNRSLRVAEKERRKNKAGDPYVVALKYFSDGRTGLRLGQDGSRLSVCYKRQRL